MTNIPRKTAKIFAETAPTGQVGVYGSKAAGSPAYSKDPAVIQSLDEYVEGLYSGTQGFSPAIEDMNALFYLMSYQVAYTLQKGIPEWDAGTTYYLNSFVSSGGLIYRSVQNTNLNHAVSDPAWWDEFSSGGGSGGLTPVDINSTGTCDPNTLESVDLSGGVSITRTLPPLPGIGDDPISVVILDTGFATDTIQVIVAGTGAEPISTFGAGNTVSLNVAKSWFGFYAYPGATEWTIQYSPLTVPQGGQLPGIQNGETIADPFVGNSNKAKSTGSVVWNASATYYTVASILVPKGKFSIAGMVGFLSSNASSVTRFIAGISLTPGAMDDLSYISAMQVNLTTMTQSQYQPTPRRIVNFSTPTTVYLVGLINYGSNSGTFSADSFIEYLKEG